MDFKLAEPFYKSSKDIIKQMAGMDIDISGRPNEETGEIQSSGVASVINFAGKIKGRFIVDMEPAVALEIAKNILGEPCNDMKDRMFVAAISEMNNIIAGDANTELNNLYSLGLRLAPPIVLTGRNIIVATPKISSVTFLCSAVNGKITLNIGFQGGAV